MTIIDSHIFRSIASGDRHEAKAVFNASGAIFFAANLQHRDQKASGISYKDNYAGNALAAMVTPGRFEIRYHRAFADARVAEIVEMLTAEPGLSCLRDWEITYQGRRLVLPD